MRCLFSLLLALSILSSCSSKTESPVIYFSNLSESVISDIECVWARNETLTLPYLHPGDSRGQSFYITSNDDFFGPVYISWRNKSGYKIIREFDFKKNNLPSIEIDRSYDYVQFYLDQEGMDIVSSDAPDLSYKTVRMDKKLRDIKRLYGRSNGISSLVRVQHNDVPHR